MVFIELRLRYAAVADLCRKYTEFSVVEHAENDLMHSGIGAMSIDIRPFSLGIVLIPLGIGAKQTGIALIQIDFALIPIDIGSFSLGIVLMQVGNGAIHIGIVSMSIENGMIPMCIGAM